MDIETRPARPDDFTLARAAHHAGYRDVVERQFRAWDEQLQDGFFAHDWNHQAAEMILANGEVCGYWTVEERPEDIHLRELVIHPTWQSRGIGRFLLTQLQQRAAAREVPIRLGTFPQNHAARLYEHVGFRIFDRTDTHLLMEWRPGERERPDRDRAV
jgi:GNAT superfamily N-acetyltransferase